jgi:hypothetical protein
MLTDTPKVLQTRLPMAEFQKYETINLGKKRGETMGMTLAEEFKNTGENTTGKSKSMLFIKLTYWLGIGADALWAIGLLIPQVYAILTGTPGFAPDFQTRQLMLLGGSLMTGWTFLLIWALQKPVERRGILLLTAFPVVFGLIITTVNGISNGNPLLFWVLIKCTLLMLTMVSSYILAGKLARTAKNSR